jgi:general secretion pathway protein H
MSSGQRGFTLLELLVVLTIMALVTAVGMPLLRGGHDGVTVRREVTVLANELRRARQSALTNATGSGIEFDLARRTLRPAAGALRRLPDGLAVSVDTTRSQTVDRQAGRIWFYPDGSSTGGRVTLADGRHVYRIDIDWITGRVTTSSN